MTQSELAKEVGVRHQQIQKYETGANRILAARLWDLAYALSVPVSYFYSDLGEPNRNLERRDNSDAALWQKETLDLVRAYYAMDEGPRRRLFELAQAASRNRIGTEILPIPESQTAA